MLHLRSDGLSKLVLVLMLVLKHIYRWSTGEERGRLWSYRIKNEKKNVVYSILFSMNMHQILRKCGKSLHSTDLLVLLLVLESTSSISSGTSISDYLRRHKVLDHIEEPLLLIRGYGGTGCDAVSPSGTSHYHRCGLHDLGQVQSPVYQRPVGSG